MIHRIDHENRHLYRVELAELHRLRAACFIDERGWPLVRTEDGESDDYDDETAVQLAAFDEAGGITAACRIRPTEYGGLIPDHFPHLVAAGVRELLRAGCYECTRYFCVPGLRGQRGIAARSALHVAMIEHMLDIGGDRLVGFVDLPLLTHLRRFSGLRIAPIGTPHHCDDGSLTVAFDIGVTPDDLRATREKLSLSHRQLFGAPSWIMPGLPLRSWADALALLMDDRTAPSITQAVDSVRARELQCA